MKFKFTTQFLAMAFFVSIFFHLKAQTTLDSIVWQYDSLEPYVHTGYLYNRFPFSPFIDSGYSANPNSYNGNAQSEKCSYSVFRQIVADFRIANYDSTRLPTREQFNQYEYSHRNRIDVPISVLALNYQKLNPFAADSGWITFDTTLFKYLPGPDSLRIYDTIFNSSGGIVSIIDTSIYRNSDSLIQLALDEFQLFSASTLPNAFGIPTLNTPVSFSLPDSLFYSNFTFNFLIKVDFGYGAGFQNIAKNQVVSINYASFGKKEIKIKFEIPGWAGSEYPIAKTQLTLFKTALPPDEQFLFSDLLVNSICPNLTDGGFSTSEGRVSIRYADPTYKKLTKPFILVEGFDSHLRDSKIDYNGYDKVTKGYGRLTWNGFASGIIFNDDGDTIYKQLKQSPLFLDSLSQLGYDILILDFKGNLSGIERTSNALIKVIRWVNQEKVTDEELVIIGGSMGGLITRYALRKMELEDCCHQTRLYGTFDTPHKGANIPLGLQEFVHNGWSNFGNQEAKDTYKNVIESRSATQLLKYHRDAFKERHFHELQHKLDSMGHPEDVYRIAISNGNAKGIGLDILPGEQLIKYELKHDVIRSFGTLLPFTPIPQFDKMFILQANAFAVPNSPNAPSNKVILETKPKEKTLNNYYLNLGISAIGIGLIYGFSAGKILKDIIYPPSTPINLASYLIITSAALLPINLNLISLINENQQIQTNRILNRPTLPIDYCPGSLTNTIEEAAGRKFSGLLGTNVMMYVGTVKALHNNHTFIPSVSSIDLPDSMRITNGFSFEKVKSQNLSPFHDFYFPNRDPFRHEFHVEITQDNRRWAIWQIEANKPILHDLGTTLTKTLPNTFNWGNPARVILHNVTVQNGGKMYVNANRPLDFSGSTPGIASNFILKTSYCGSLIEINGGGLMELGENNYVNLGQGLDNNKSEVYFRKNSVLEIFPGGTLRVNDNSKLEIQEGAEIILHPGAVIDLNGSNAQLILKGKITLKNGSSLSPTGEGKIIFAQPMVSQSDANTFWEVEPQTSVKIQGQNQEVRVEVLENLYFPNGLDSVVFDGISTLIQENKAIFNLENPMRIQNTVVNCMDTTQYHNGIRLFGNPTIVKGSTFNHGTIGLSNILSNHNGPWEIFKNTFKYNLTGLLTHEESVILNECTFKYNDIGWKAEAMQGDCLVEKSIFAQNGIAGIDLISQAGVLLYTNESGYNDNQIGIHIKKANLRAQCSNFDNSTYGVIAEEGNMLHLNQNAQNKFTNNYVSLSLDLASGVFLEDGYNDFQGSTWFVYGELTALNASPSIDINQNNMPGIANGNQVTLPFNCYFDNGNNSTVQIPVTNWVSNPIMPLSCTPQNGTANPGNDLAQNTMLSFTSSKVVTSTNYQNWWLNNALANASFYVSDHEGIYNDLIAISRFSEILSSINGPYTESEEQAINYALELMITALNNAYTQGLIPQNEAALHTTEHPYLQMVTDELRNRMNESGISTETAFHLNLALAQTYRMAEHYDYALSVIDSSISPTTPEQILTSDYWECVCQAEERLMTEQINPEQFSIELQICRSSLNLLEYYQSQTPSGSSTVSQSISGSSLTREIYPNPTQDVVYLTLKRSDSKTTIKVYDAFGKKVKSFEFPKGNRKAIIDMKEYEPGVYFLNIQQGEILQTEKIVKSPKL